jgi:hypothetical protein
VVDYCRVPRFLFSLCLGRRQPSLLSTFPYFVTMRVPLQIKSLLYQPGVIGQQTFTSGLQEGAKSCRGARYFFSYCHSLITFHHVSHVTTSSSPSLSSCLICHAIPSFHTAFHGRGTPSGCIVNIRLTSKAASQHSKRGANYAPTRSPQHC